MIKIAQSNAARIAKMLLGANDLAIAHTYSTEDVFRLALDAEGKLRRFGLSKKDMRGAEVSAVSSENVSNSYARKGWRRAATRVLLVRRSTGWFIVRADRIDVGQTGGGVRFILTSKQDAIAMAEFRRGYGVR